jgi:hypothetical protein
MSRDTAPIGFLARNWPSLNDNNPAVIVNGAAHPLDVLAWCWGEVESLHQVAIVCEGAGMEGMDGAALGAVFLHRLKPLSAVMHDAIHALEREKDCMSALPGYGEDAA